MRSPAKPFALLVVVSAATFGLAKWHPFSPSVAAATAGMPTGDAKRGAAVFATSCSGCHGVDASGGVGPSLAGGVPAATALAVVATGKGVMPAGLVKGQDAADVAAYVGSLGK